MNSILRRRLNRTVFLASGALLILGNHVSAQSVRTFDDAPSVEQLRSILVPESRSGVSRTIVIQRPITSTGPSSIQPAVTESVSVQEPSAAGAERHATQGAQPGPVQTANQSPAASTTPAGEAGGVAFHINFAFNSATLPDSAHEMIDRIAQLMKETPQLKLRIEGHTDAAGSAEYNLSLSTGRALSVAQYLAAQGVSRDRLILVGKGKTEPLTRDPYEPANRRVQFVRVG